MSPAIDLDVKERVRAAVDIIDIASAGWELRKSGGNYIARCPWHDDHRPSLTINPVRQTWRCWVCDIGGDVFSLVMRRDGLSFPEALRMLADRAGIRVETLPGTKQAAPGSPEDRETLLKAAAWAEERFFDALQAAPEGEAARRYLSERNIDDASRQRFRIGYAPGGWQWLLNQAGRAGFSPQVLEAAGLVVARNSGGGFYDQFRDRLMFPIQDVQGRTIAFGGRILPGSDASGAKYINSPETKLFSKSRQLYGLAQARDAITRSRHCLVMEGYTDVVTARQLGVENAVAVLGVALTEPHVKILSRFAECVTLVLDGDTAGQKRADEVLELFVGASLDVRVLTLPDGTDPAEYLLAEGKSAFDQRVAAAPDVIDHKLQRLTRGIDVTRDTHAATAAVEEILKVLARSGQSPVGQDLRQQQILVRLSRTFGLSQELLTGRLKALRDGQQKRAARRAPQVATAAPPKPQRRPLEGVDRELFELLIEDPHLAGQAVEAIDPSWLSSDTAREILAAYQRIEFEGGSFESENLLLAVDDPDLHSMIVRMESRVQDRTNWRSELSVSTVERFSRILEAYRRTEWQRSTERQLAQIEAKSVDAQEELEFLQQLIATQRFRQGVESRGE